MSKFLHRGSLHRFIDLYASPLQRRIIVISLPAISLLLIGTLGYMWIEGWVWQDALFMTVVTLSTVGYGEVHPLSNVGIFYSITLILLGVGVVAYTFGALTDFIIAGELYGTLRKQRMLKKIDKLRNHHIVCGYSRVGTQVVEGLVADNLDIVVIERSQERIDALEQKNLSYIIGDATDDETLREAGIDHAHGLCTCLPSDADNVFVTLTARTLNENLVIIARCNISSSERKLRIAGASHVINPYDIAGRRMATQLIQPSVIEFLDVLMQRGGLELYIEEVVIQRASTLEGKTLGEGHIRNETGVNVLAVRRSQHLFTDLGYNFSLEAEDVLISLGTPEQLESLTQRASHLVL